MTSFSRRLLALVLALPLLALASPATAAPSSLSLSFERPAGLPIAVPRATEDRTVYPRYLGFTVTGPPGTPVDIEMSADGILVDPGTQQLVLDEAGVAHGHVLLEQPDPGLHALSAAASAAGLDPATAGLPYLFTPGGWAVTGGDSLAGQAFEVAGSDAVGESTYERREYLVWFLDGTWAHLDPAAAGRPTCTHVSRQCLRYRYDAATGLVQVGADIIGRIDATHTFLVGADTPEGPDFSDETRATHPSDASGSSGRTPACTRSGSIRSAPTPTASASSAWPCARAVPTCATHCATVNGWLTATLPGPAGSSIVGCSSSTSAAAPPTTTAG